MTTYTYTKFSGPPDTFGGVPLGVNDTDQIVGSYNDSNGGTFGFVYSNGVYTTINDPLATSNYTSAIGINNLGQIVGTYSVSTNIGAIPQGFLYSNGVYTTIDDPLATGGTIAAGINNLGQIAGSYRDFTGAHGFLYSNGNYTTLDDPLATGHFTVPTGINDAGQIVGHYITASSNGANGFLYSNGVYTTIDDPLGTYSTSADGINNAGQIVGHYEVGLGGPVYMFVYSNGVYTTIDDPVGALPTPAAINDLGQIVGYDQVQPFLATPTPTVIAWKQGISGDFATASNWKPAAVPGPGDDATISAKGTYTVTSSANETVDSLSILDKHATLLIDGASTFSDAIGGVNDGTIVVDGSRMIVDTYSTNTTVSNVGTIDLDNSSLEIGLFPPASAMVLLTGGGHINLSGGGIGSSISEETVVSDNTISGTGDIDFSAGGQEAHGTWINQGIIDASTPTGTLAITHTRVENSGVLEATDGGLLDFNVAPLHNEAQGVVEAKGQNSAVILGNNLMSGIDINAGLIEAIDSGTVVFQDVAGTGPVDNTNGTIKASHGSTVAVETTIHGGFVTVLNGGLLESTDGYYPYPGLIAGAVITNAGTIGAESENLTINGDVTNAKGILDANDATLVIDGAVHGGKATIEGTGEIEFGGASSANVTFAANSDGILKLDHQSVGDPSAFTGTVSGLNTGGFIDLTNINFADNPTLSYSSKTHVLTVTDNVSHVTDAITFKGAVGSFSAQSDGSGGTFITDPPPPANTVAVSHDQFVFASNLGENGGKATNANVQHNEPIDFLHQGGELADLAAIMVQAHAVGAHLMAGPDAIDMHHSAALTAHHSLV